MSSEFYGSVEELENLDKTVRETQALLATAVQEFEGISRQTFPEQASKVDVLKGSLASLQVRRKDLLKEVAEKGPALSELKPDPEHGRNWSYAHKSSLKGDYGLGTCSEAIAEADLRTAEGKKVTKKMAEGYIKKGCQKSTTTAWLMLGVNEATGEKGYKVDLSSSLKKEGGGGGKRSLAESSQKADEDESVFGLVLEDALYPLAKKPKKEVKEEED